MKYQNCIFALYGTLIDIHTDESAPLLWEKMALFYSAYGALYQPDELKAAYFRLVRQQVDESKAKRQDEIRGHPEIRLERIFAALFAEKNLAADPDMAVHMGHLFRRHSMEYIRLYDGAEDLLRTLRANGQNVYLLANAQRIFTDLELRDLQIEALFDGVWISSDYDCKKPDPKFYHLLLDSRNLKPEETIMVGSDSVCDIQGAQAVGLSTLYLHSNISPPEPTPQADYVLDSVDLSKVKEILTQP